MYLKALPLLLAVLWLPAAVADAPRTGEFGTSFTQTTPLADGGEVLKRLLHPLVYDQWQAAGRIKPGQTIDPTQETWQVYVPSDYDGSQAYGVLVWVSWGPDGRMEGNWRREFREHKLIYIGADKSGNYDSVPGRRVPLALTGLINIEAQYKIDPARIYIAGFSGGGVTASRIAAAYSDVFTGGLFVSTSNGLGSHDVPVPPLERYSLMRSRGRYVFTSGEEETSNLIINARSVSQYRALCVSRVDYIHIPNASHRDIDSRIFDHAMTYLDTPPAVDPAAQADCEKNLADRRTQAVEQVNQALAADDKDKAWSQLQEFSMEFGPMAEPEFTRIATCIAQFVSIQGCTAGAT
ncbi:MAG TPA: PHB depolymerase family esterase [Gammaproteobacteria bacterium]|nr:PHB depolymerase family esterase [Gammaproteobacteria bacterium]